MRLSEFNDAIPDPALLKKKILNVVRQILAKDILTTCFIFYVDSITNTVSSIVPQICIIAHHSSRVGKFTFKNTSNKNKILPLNPGYPEPDRFC